MINLKKIPAIDEILNHQQVKDYIYSYNRGFIVDIVRKVTGQIREQLKKEPRELNSDEIMEMIIFSIKQELDEIVRGTLQKVINGTGVVLHTNLGRAPLGSRAIEYINDIAGNYINLEINLEEGKRGSRYTHVEHILTRLTGAEAALVVNNNAAAVLLALNTLAKDRQVIVSRGQLIEIGGAFRIPEVMKISGANLVEVGTTNRTYIYDYARAITSETALIFSAHTSNYKIIGFSQETKLEDLVKLGEAHRIPVMQDLGSGILCPLGEWGLREEPTVQKSLDCGVDVVTFSGDKLLGGPQAGIIVGKKKYIEAMKENQLTRALRVDKLTIAGLEGTLIEYLTREYHKKIPIVKMLTQTVEELEKEATLLKELINANNIVRDKICYLEITPVKDMVGGGAYPTYELPGYGLMIGFKGIQLEEIATRLRTMRPALLTRKQEDKMLVSVRTLMEDDYTQIVTLLERAFYQWK